MVCRLIDFALVFPKLLIFKVCGIISISNIEFFNFSGKLKKIKNHSKPPKLVSQSLFKKFQQSPSIFLVFHWNFNPFTSFTPLGRWNIDLPLDSNTSKMGRVNISFKERFLKNIQWAQWFSSYWCLKVVELWASQKSSFSIFLILKGLKTMKFGQLIECNMRNSFFWKIIHKIWWRSLSQTLI